MGFSFGGIHSDDLGLTLLRDTRKDLLPQPKDLTEEIAGKHGKIYFDTYLDERILEISCVVEGTDRSDMLSKRQSVAALFGLAGEQELIFDDDPDKVYYARYAGRITPDDYSYWTTFTIPLRCSDPFIYDAEETEFAEIIDGGTLTITGKGDVNNHMVIQIIAIEGTQAQAVDIDGEEEANSAIDSTLIDPTLTIGDKTINYTGTINPGSVLEIDNENFTAMLDGVNALGNISGDWPLLPPGDNEITFSDSNSTTGAMIKINYKGRWL